MCHAFSWKKQKSILIYNLEDLLAHKVTFWCVCGGVNLTISSSRQVNLQFKHITEFLFVSFHFRFQCKLYPKACFPVGSEKPCGVWYMLPYIRRCTCIHTHKGGGGEKERSSSHLKE